MPVPAGHQVVKNARSLLLDIAPDQQATRPKPGLRLTVFVSIEIGSFAVGPVMKPGAFCAITGGKALPCSRIEITGNLKSGSCDERLT